MGQLIMHSMYPGKQVGDLQESDKQIISALSTRLQVWQAA